MSNKFGWAPNHIINPYEVTAFGERRVSIPYTLADFICKYGRVATLDLETKLVGAATVVDVPTSSAFRMATAGGAADVASVRSSSYFRYQSGRGLKITHSGVVEVAPTGVQTIRFGFFDDNDGPYWEIDSVGASLNIRSSTSGAPVVTKIPQSQWDDPTPAFPGAYTSLAGSIYELQAQWLGVGDVECFINGSLVHTIRHQNIGVLPYMRTADLPLSWEVSNGGVINANPCRFLAICGNVTVQSGQAPPQFGFCATRDAMVAVGAGPAYIPMLSVRLAALLNGVDNRELVYPSSCHLSCEAGRTAYEIILNPTLTGPTAFNPVGGNSGMEFDIASTGITAATGEVVAVGFLPNINDSDTNDLTEIFKVNARKMRRSSFTGVSDILVAVGRGEGGAANMRAAFQWDEVR